MSEKHINPKGKEPTEVRRAIQKAALLLKNFPGDQGAGGGQGLVPKPETGDATKYLKGDGTWGNPLAGIAFVIAWSDVVEAAGDLVIVFTG